MNPLKHALLSGYYGATYPWRRHFQRAARRAAVAPVMVLFYHRVADHGLNPWTIRTADFLRHLDWLQERFELVSLAEAQQRIASRYNTRACVAITFDDGYAENCEVAIPELIRRQIPVTYFVTLGNALSGEPFPHDVALGRPAAPNSVDQLREMAGSGLIEIGGHTRTHADLGKLRDHERLYDEVVAATDELEQHVGQAIRYFAFPYGLHANLSDAAIQLCRQHGLAGFCSAYGGYNLPGDDPYHLQRIHGDPELARLRNWLTIDPRKLRGVVRYQPQYDCQVAEVEAACV